MADQASPKLPNPRGRRTADRKVTPRAPGGSMMWYVLGFLLLLALAQAFFLSVQSGETLSYSDFRKAVRDGQVTELTLGDDRIRGALKNEGGKPRNFSTVRVEDPKLVEDLESHSVKYTGEVTSRWIGELLSWVIPLVLLVALWSFFFRRMGGAEGGVMSFARSRAKIYAEDDVPVRF